MVAYTGTYRVEGNKWITKVDVAANPALLGTEQARSTARSRFIVVPSNLAPRWPGLLAGVNFGSKGVPVSWVWSLLSKPDQRAVVLREPGRRGQLGSRGTA